MPDNSRLDTRHMFQRVFTKSTDGRIVLFNILNNLGYFETDPEQIKPELIAFANRLLHDVGINTPGAWMELIEKMCDCATDRDLIQEDK